MGQSVDSSCINFASPRISIVWEKGCDGSKCGQFMNLAPSVSVSHGR